MAKKIIKIRAEVNEIEMKKIQIINKCKSWFFEKISKIDPLLSKLTKGQRKMLQIKITVERGE